ncbi:MAG: DUF6913 domain-containing protein [bacterium]
MLEFIKNIRRKQIIRDLKAAPREKRIDNIQEVQSIGIICHLTDEQSWNILYHFAKVMENQGKTIHLIAMQDNEINFVVTHQGTTICRSKTDLNFWGLPSWDSIKSFADRQYDLLIDTIGSDYFFSQYIALRTTASLKVAYASPTEDPSDIYDLIIRGEGNIELKDYFNNIIEYLGMIKK